MAEEVQNVRNKKLLLVALLLGGLVVVVYNLHIDAVRRAGTGKQVILLRFKRDMKRGEKVTANSLRKVYVDEGRAKALGHVVYLESEADFDAYQDQKLTRDVEVGQLLKPEQLSLTETESPSRRLDANMVAHPLMLDPRLSPGEILRPGDRVNVLAEFQFHGRDMRFYRVIEAVQVHTVGGMGAEEPVDAGRGRLANQGGVRAFRTITVEVKPDVSLKLAELTKNKIVRVEVLSSSPRLELPDDAGQINPKLEQLAREAGILPREET
jgi:Flp pilus assembly protein CpaB